MKRKFIHGVQGWCSTIDMQDIHDMRSKKARRLSDSLRPKSSPSRIFQTFEGFYLYSETWFSWHETICRASSSYPFLSI